MEIPGMWTRHSFAFVGNNINSIAPSTKTVLSSTYSSRRGLIRALRRDFSVDSANGKVVAPAAW